MKLMLILENIRGIEVQFWCEMKKSLLREQFYRILERLLKFFTNP